MLPFLYWTNLSGVYDGIIFRDTIYLATFGGILVLNRNLDSLRTYKFSEGTNSNIIVSVDTFRGKVYYLTKNRGFGYIENNKVFHFPISRLPRSNLSNAKGLFSYNNYLFIYGYDWILYIVGNSIRTIETDVYNIKPRIGSIFVYNDTVYIGDSLGYLKTHINFVDIPASFQRVNLPRVNYIGIYNGEVIFGTDKGIYDKFGNSIVSGFSTIYFEKFRDTLFISTRNQGQIEVYGPGNLKKYYNGIVFDEPNYKYTYFLMSLDTILLVSTFHYNSLSIYVDNVAFGIYTYPNYRNYKFGFPFNYISNTYSLNDYIFLFTHTDYDYTPQNLNYAIFIPNKNKIIELGDSVYRITKPIKISDTLLGISSFFSYFLIDTSLGVRFCIAVPTFPVDPTKAFTSLALYKDTIYIGSYNGEIYKVDKNCNSFSISPYSYSVSTVSDMETNGSLIAIGGNGGIAIFQDGNLLYKNSSIIPLTIETYNDKFIIGTSSGIYIYEQELRKLNTFPDKAITDIVVDKVNNTLFVLSEDGLYRLNENYEIIENYKISGITYLQATNFPLLHTLSIYKDSILLVGSSEGVGLIRIASLSEGSLIVYPNPAREYLKIKNLKGNFEYEVFILTISGKKVKNMKLRTDASGEMRIRINDLERGLYILRISNKSIKFLKS